MIAATTAVAAGLFAGCSNSASSSSTTVPSNGSTSGTTTSSLDPPRVTWMRGAQAAGTPSAYNRVGVIKIGPSSARNVLVLEPGTSAGAAYFVPLAQWVTSRMHGWQVWSVERRENLLEDQSELNRYKEHKVSSAALYDYYLGYIKNRAITRHVLPVPNSSVEFAKQWGMAVAVQDLHVVIGAAAKLGGKVVLGGHSLGGSVVTAYATWNFEGRPGADQLAGLVYIDGGSTVAPPSAAVASQQLQQLEAPGSSPWLAFGGIAAPYAGIFSSTGAAAALLDPNSRSLGQSSGLLPAAIVPPVPVTNRAQFGYALNASTSPANLLAAQAHLGQGINANQPVHGWNGAGALTPVSRFATMFSGYPMLGVDGSEWFFPQRLTDDTSVVDNGNANPAQSVLGVDATMGHSLPKSLLIYAFGARLGGPAVLADAQALAAQSGIPASNLTLVNRQATYSHNDPAGAYPRNDFVNRLVPFLHRVASG
jgi:pimeloyl-ACP methyl ester carboxylesterase